VSNGVSGFRIILLQLCQLIHFVPDICIDRSRVAIFNPRHAHFKAEIWQRVALEGP